MQLKIFVLALIMMATMSVLEAKAFPQFPGNMCSRNPCFPLCPQYLCPRPTQQPKTTTTTPAPQAIPAVQTRINCSEIRLREVNCGRNPTGGVCKTYCG